MFGLGVPELLIILVIVIFIYGGKRMPQIGEGLGKMISEFKKANKASTESTPLESRQVKNTAAKPLPEQKQPD
jgi:sec-independent protein translocase protein TatA